MCEPLGDLLTPGLGSSGWKEGMYKWYDGAHGGSGEPGAKRTAVVNEMIEEEAKKKGV